MDDTDRYRALQATSKAGRSGRKTILRIVLTGPTGNAVIRLTCPGEAI